MSKQFKDWLDEFVENGADADNVTEWPKNSGGSDSGSTAIDMYGDYSLNLQKFCEIIDELQIEWPGSNRNNVAEIGYSLEYNIYRDGNGLNAQPLFIVSAQYASGGRAYWMLNDLGSSYNIDYDENKSLSQLILEHAEELEYFGSRYFSNESGECVIGAARPIDEYNSANPYTCTFNIHDLYIPENTEEDEEDNVH